MKLKRIWKKQLICFVGIFLVLLAVGVLLHVGMVVISGGILLIVSAVAAAVGLHCPACGSGVFKQAMDRTPDGGFTCPKCGQQIEWDA